MEALEAMQNEADAIDASLAEMKKACASGHNPCNCLKGDELAFVYNRRADLVRRIEQLKQDLAAEQKRQDETPLWGVARLLNDFSK